MVLETSEIFYSIQGESTYAGLPCTFVRLAGCNLRCTYCDTKYAYAPVEHLQLSTVVERVLSHACPLVEITGGEPLLQPETPELIESLLREGKRVLVETNGSQPRTIIDSAAVAVMDVKCPGSGESGSFHETNLKTLEPHDELKFVISDRNDYLWAADFLQRPGFPDCSVHFSPVHGLLSPRELAQWMLEDKIQVRLALQLHKILWPPGTPGV